MDAVPTSLDQAFGLLAGLGRVFQEGGWLMLPIGLCSLVGLAVVLERLYALRRRRLFPSGFLPELKRKLAHGAIAEALDLCQSRNEPLSRILEAGILRHRHGREVITEAIEASGRQEMEVLERHLDLLASIANIAPLLGLLGTVTGMIQVFDGIREHGVGDPSILAGGISEALITTAAGLSVAIPALFLHGHLRGRAQRYLLRMEKAGLEVLELLVHGRDAPGAARDATASEPETELSFAPLEPLDLGS